MRRDVAVTGLGVVSPLGTTTEENWDALLAGKHMPGPISAFDCPAAFPSQSAGEIKQFDPRSYGIKPKSLKLMNRTIQYALAAAQLALNDAGACRDDACPAETGLNLGVDGIQYSADDFFLSSYEAVGKDMRKYYANDVREAGGPVTLNDPDKAVHPLWPLSVLSNMGLCHVAIQHDLQGPNAAYSSIDAGGAQAIGEAAKSIRQGECDVYLAGGSYALNTMHFLSLASLGLLARECADCRPFHSGSSGCLVGEGAVILVLEEKGRALKRGARIYAEIAGYAACFNAAADMFSSGSVCPDGDGLELCIRRALADAGCAADEIAYISSDAKGIAAQDRTEAGVLNRLFCEQGRRVPVGMTKALTGHMLPASGAFNALNAVLSVHHGCVPPSGCAAGSDMCGGLSVSEAPQQLAVPCALSHTFGLSGEHTALVIKENTI